MSDKEALEILEPTLKVYKSMANDEAGKAFVEAFKRAVDALKERSERN